MQEKKRWGLKASYQSWMKNNGVRRNKMFPLHLCRRAPVSIDGVRPTLNDESTTTTTTGLEKRVTRPVRANHTLHFLWRRSTEAAGRRASAWRNTGGTRRPAVRSWSAGEVRLSSHFKWRWRFRGSCRNEGGTYDPWWVFVLLRERERERGGKRSHLQAETLKHKTAWQVCSCDKKKSGLQAFISSYDSERGRERERERKGGREREKRRERERERKGGRGRGRERKGGREWTPPQPLASEDVI